MKIKQKTWLNRFIGTGMALSAIFYLSYPYFPDRLKTGLYLDGCIFKSATHLPCPGCGYDRSMQNVLRGDFTEAFYYHPLFPFLLGLALFFVYAGIKISLTGKLLNINKIWVYLIVLLVIIGWIMKFVLGERYY